MFPWVGSVFEDFNWKISLLCDFSFYYEKGALDTFRTKRTVSYYGDIKEKNIYICPIVLHGTNKVVSFIQAPLAFAGGASVLVM